MFQKWKYLFTWTGKFQQLSGPKMRSWLFFFFIGYLHNLPVVCLEHLIILEKCHLS